MACSDTEKWLTSWLIAGSYEQKLLNLPLFCYCLTDALVLSHLPVDYKIRSI